MRPIADHELEAFARADAVAFASSPPDHAALEDARDELELDRTLAVFDEGKIVATAAALSLELTLPGLTTVPAAGVAYVGVVPTHRRKGLLRRMMERQLAHVSACGEPLAVLHASEAGIYGRFGYGLATSRACIELDRHHGALLPSSEPAGQLLLLEAEEAAPTLPAIFDRARRRQPGEVSRSPRLWKVRLRDRHRGEDRSPRFFVVHQQAGEAPDGYAVYRVRGRWEHGTPRSQVAVEEVVALTGVAEAALWQFLLSIDLTEVVEAHNRPLEDPLRWMLREARPRVTGMSDALWVRLVDVATALSSRRYPVSGRLVLEVGDGFRPDSSGCYTLEGGPDGAACHPSQGPPDLAMDVADLGALYLGGVRASTLARAGRVKEVRGGALARADTMLASHPLPFCRTFF